MPRRSSIPKGYVRAEDALRMILDGSAPDELKVAGTLSILKPERPIWLPKKLTVNSLTLTCHQAAAWIAGFDNPDDYKPLIET